MTSPRRQLNLVEVGGAGGSEEVGRHGRGWRFFCVVAGGVDCAFGCGLR